MKKAIVEALETVRNNHPEGILQPKAVVDAARPKNSPLHGYFEWNDSAAAERYRLDQARELIVKIMIVRDDVAEPFQAYVSLPSSRTKKRGGYHAMHDVMSSDVLKAELLKSALNDLNNFQERYQRLAELAEVFKAIVKVRRRTRRKAA